MLTEQEKLCYSLGLIHAYAGSFIRVLGYTDDEETHKFLEEVSTAVLDDFSKRLEFEIDSNLVKELKELDWISLMLVSISECMSKYYGK